MFKHVRVLAPAASLSIVDERIRRIAEENLRRIGWEVSFSESALAKDTGSAELIRKKVVDIHEALSDKNVTHLMAAIGGWSSHELLPYIDWDLWRRNPKPLIGYSDITALQNALFCMSGCRSIHGPVFSTFGQPSHLTYTVDQFLKCVREEEYILDQAPEWLDDPWYELVGERHSVATEGYKVLSAGNTTGWVIGGNLSTFMLLAGTKYLPPLAGSVIFLEEVELVSVNMLRRWIVQLSQQHGASQIVGIVVGRFQHKSPISVADLAQIFEAAGFMGRMPIIAEASFGHTYPVGSFPIGGYIKIEADKKPVRIAVVRAPV